MTEKKITNIDSFISDSSQYNGEIFVNISTSENFAKVKSFIDENKLIAFLPYENTIYAQSTKYTGITSEQMSSLSTYGASIDELNKKIAIIDNDGTLTDDEKESVIGTLTYGTGSNQITKTNVTDFVISVLERIEAGDSAISTELDTINERIDSLGTALQSTLNLIVTGQYATKVTSEDSLISVELVETENNDDETPFVPPYTYKISSNNIASKSDLDELSSSVDSKIASKIAEIVDDAPESLDTLKEIANWIESHPGDTVQMSADINTLKTKVAELLGTVTEEYTDPDTGQTVTHIKTFSNGSLSGESWAASIEEINELFTKVSFAKNVEDNAEANKIDEIDFVEQDASSLTGEASDNSVQFGTSTLDNKNIGISVNIELLNKIKSNIETIAASDATIKANAALASSKEYTDERLSWLVV